MEHTVRVNWVGAAAAVAGGIGVAVVASTALATRAFESRVAQIERADQMVTVKGYARAPVRSDTATWSVGVSGGGATLADAFADIDAATGRLTRFLEGQGFEASEILASAIETAEVKARDERGRVTNRIEGYRLSRTVTVSTGAVDRVAFAAGAVTELLADNVPVVSSAPSYTVSTLPAVKVDIIGRASADARQRAEEIASKAGASVAEVRSARQGVMQVTAPASTSVSSYGIYDTTTIDKEASIVMTITFGLEGV